jgi:alcohol dehydrogenase, propanol-preferring
MLGDLGARPSAFGVRSPGHEGAGYVAKIGPGVTGWTIGDRAGMKPMWDVCHNCELCWSGTEQYCSKVVHTGMMVPGSYQEYVLMPAIYTSRIPDGVPDEIAGPIMCSASTMHRALLDSGLVTGNWVVFPGGGGGVGIQGVQLSKIMGMRPIVIDSGSEKRRLSLEMGAEHFFDFREEKDIPGAIKTAADGIGAHGVFVTAWQSYKGAHS